MRTTTLIALPVAAALALGGASLATADDPPKVPERPTNFKLRAPVSVMAHQEIGPFGLDRELAADVARELDLPEERVAAALKKAIGARFDRRRDEALKCFDDKKQCARDELPALVKPIHP